MLNRPELSPQSEAKSLLDESRSLWREAPVWRTLTITTLVLTAMTSAVLILQQPASTVQASRPEAEAQHSSVAKSPENSTCGIKPGPLFPDGSGKIIGFLSQSEASDLLQRTEMQLRARINPHYLTNLRAVVEPSGFSGGRRYIAIVPKTLAVRVGDQIEYAGGYTDTSMPCHYIPNLISRVIEPPASADGTSSPR
jgi:hypothetical protein